VTHHIPEDPKPQLLNCDNLKSGPLGLYLLGLLFQYISCKKWLSVSSYFIMTGDNDEEIISHSSEPDDVATIHCVLRLVVLRCIKCNNN
jgi:zona occludens toxin (predicted ATPase)